MEIDLEKYLDNKLDIEFVSELTLDNRVGTIVGTQLAIIEDKKTRKEKELIELKIDFPKLKQVRTILPNQKSLKNLGDVFGKKVNLWIGYQVVPKTHLFSNKMLGVLLEPLKEEK